MPKKKVKELLEDTTVSNKITEIVEDKAMRLSRQIDCKHQNLDEKGTCLVCGQLT